MLSVINKFKILLKNAKNLLFKKQSFNSIPNYRIQNVF